MLAAQSTSSDKNAVRSVDSFPSCNDDNPQHHRRLTLDMQRVASEDTRRRPLHRQPSNDSMRSTVSVGSILIGTAGKLSKWPKAVKSSVRGIVAKSRAGHRHDDSCYHTEPGFSSMFRKRTPSVLGLANMFSRRRTSMEPTNVSATDVTPSTSSTCTVSETNNTTSSTEQILENMTATGIKAEHKRYSTHSRISIIDEETCADTMLRKLSLQENVDEPSTAGVGNLLFGKEIDSLFTTDCRQKGDGPTSDSQISAEHRLFKDDGPFQPSLSADTLPVTNTEPFEDNDKPMILSCDGYRIDGRSKTGATSPESEPSTPCQPDYSQFKVQHMDREAYWFRTFFVNRSYATFCGTKRDGIPVLITAAYSEGQYRLIMRTKESLDVRKTVPDSFLLNAPPLKPASLGKQSDHVISDDTWKSVIELAFDILFADLVKVDTNLVVSSGMESDILKLDELSFHTRYKFGVLPIKDGQTKEEEWFSNQDDSGRFERFLDIIGQRVALQGYPGWVAGLDTKNGDSGEYTYISTWNEHFLAYHVSTLIPSKQGDKQQIQRKRHIGNDIVCVVFVDGQQPFNPAAIKSQFLHVFIVVREDEWEGRPGWRVEVVTVKSVPDFGPALPEHAMFFNQNELQSFMLAKLVNAEYAALKSPKLALPLARAREGILTSIVQRGLKLAEEKGSLIKSRHSKSPSTSSDRSLPGQDLSPAPSRSSVIKEFSEAVGLGRHRSVQQSQEGTDSRQRLKQRRKGKNVDVSRRSQSELDLTSRIPPTSNLSASRSSAAVLQGSETPKEDKSLKHRAHNILVSFNLGGRRTTRQEDGMPSSPTVYSPSL